MRESAFKSTVFVGVPKVSPERCIAGVRDPIVSFWGSRMFVLFFGSCSGYPQFGRVHKRIGG